MIASSPSPLLGDFPPGYVMPLPPSYDQIEKDEMQPVRVATPLPDLLPRDISDFKRMRTLRMEGDSGKRYVAPRRQLPTPYVNDEEVDEFEDLTIDTTILNVSEKDRSGKHGEKPAYHFDGPSVEGDVTPVFDSGMLYKVVTKDGAWYYYNDTDRYEMHIKFTFGAKSEIEPGNKVEMFAMNNNEFAASLIVFPGETSKMISGKVNGFKSSAKAVPLNDKKREDIYGEVNDRIADEIAEIAQDLAISEAELNEEKVLMYCEKNHKPYVDCNFRPCDYSLYRPNIDTYLPRFIPWHRPATWIPPEHLKEVRLFRREILPSHVTHGSIGDTYLASMMACLAEVDGALHDLFRHPVSAANGASERALGAYWVTVSINGWWLPVLLDDYLPATRDGPEMSRCAVDVRRMWVALLEKVHAKVHGSYANIASGDPLEPLSEFTGFPVSRFDSLWGDARNGDDMLFHEMLQYFEAGYLQMLCTPSDGGETFGNTNVVSTNPELEAKYDRMGLKLLHGYAVIQVEFFADSGIRLLRIRNPWGTGEEWTGAWGKADSRWERFPTIYNRCYASGGSPSDADRTFWMEWSDAVRIFNTGGCCHYCRPWFDYRIRGEFVQGIPTVSLEINVSAPTEAFITLTQEDERDDGALEYAALLLSVFRHNGKREKLDATSNTLVERPDCQLKFNYSRDVAMKYTFLPENCPYYVIPRAHDVPGPIKQYVLGFLPETYVGNGITVDFKKFDKECKVFNNMPSFVANGATEDVSTEFQYRNPRQPTEYVGTSIRDERLREFGLYED